VTWYLKDGYNFGVQAMRRLAWPCTKQALSRRREGRGGHISGWDILMAKQRVAWGGSASWGL